MNPVDYEHNWGHYPVNTDIVTIKRQAKLKTIFSSKGNLHPTYPFACTPHSGWLAHDWTRVFQQPEHHLDGAQHPPIVPVPHTHTHTPQPTPLSQTTDAVFVIIVIIHVDNLNMLDAGRNYNPGLLLSKRVRNDWCLKWIISQEVNGFMSAAETSKH